MRKILITASFALAWLTPALSSAPQVPSID